MSELIVSEASKTALPIPVLLDCYQSDYFLCPDPYFAELWKNGRPLDDVFSAIPFALIAESMHRLRDVVYVYFREAGDPWPIVLNALAEGRVPAVRSEGGGSTIDDIYIVDLKPWRMFLTELRLAKRSKSVRLTVAEAAFFLNTNERTVARLMRFGFLDRTLTLAAVQTFSRKYIFFKEVYLISAFAGTRLNFKYEGGALKEAGILPIGPSLHLRDRRAVERYYKGRTLPSVEASSDSEKVRRLCRCSQNAGINLTPREAQIALSARGGWKRREIAAQLGISAIVYTNTLKKIYYKCGVSSRAELGERIEILMKPASSYKRSGP
ncbi:hypothetical protein HFO60_04420 [Rhizobium leguminosarum]|uniref:helix-turn-helix transcriptional regulator n=1 Tax=Rhizobium leguminosarum TaxID=384 RepID=UPI001C969700|nr:hypothetical protein [Rhizobium leguminosarum]MBY5539297.1 hypothetical protein [Rhizobium leguminosarum]